MSLPRAPAECRNGIGKKQRLAKTRLASIGTNQTICHFNWLHAEWCTLVSILAILYASFLSFLSHHVWRKERRKKHFSNRGNGKGSNPNCGGKGDSNNVRNRAFRGIKLREAEARDETPAKILWIPPCRLFVVQLLWKHRGSYWSRWDEIGGRRWPTYAVSVNRFPLQASKRLAKLGTASRRQNERTRCIDPAQFFILSVCIYVRSLEDIFKGVASLWNRGSKKRRKHVQGLSLGNWRKGKRKPTLTQCLNSGIFDGFFRHLFRVADLRSGIRHVWTQILLVNNCAIAKVSRELRFYSINSASWSVIREAMLDPKTVSKRSIPLVCMLNFNQNTQTKFARFRCRSSIETF